MTKTALITGASRGLGAALAKELAATHHIIAVAKTTGALEELDDAIQTKGGQSTLAPMDITVDPAMQQLCRSIYDRWGKLDLWLHTAIHAAPLAPVDHISDSDFGKSLEVNVAATARLMRYVAPLLGTTGQAVFFDDPQAGKSFYGSYGATKSAQIALARSWQKETRKTGPKIRIVTPDPMPSATRARFFPGEDRNQLSPAEDQARKIIASFE